MSDFFTMEPGEVAAPVPDGPVLCTGTAAMRRIHRVFLWSYDEAPGLARSAAAGDTERSRYVGEVLANIDKVLHVHHEGEDQLMYPQLRERAPACALHVDQMLAQHAEVKTMLDQIAPIRERWTATADPAVGEELAQHYERLSARLKVHLRREVTEVMPAVDRVLTNEEFEQLAAHGFDQFEKKVVIAYLGMILAANPIEDQREFFKEAPAFARVAYRLVGKRMYRKQYATLFPGRPIPDTI
ncbi:hemerythrin domain-containing protein [Demequina silvatica]|uniref:hemerythrin domain-containing protein n=1 Tax=Demequina silvatica TaxID=1638988 RepID=UPI000782532B|nr:hemerythrin domain-containing protein [Demequina silvatica]